MTLFFQSSALSFYKRDFILAGVGPHLYLIENEKIIRKFSFFDNNMRIIFIKIVDDQIFTFAENLLIIFSLSNDFDVEKLFKIQYPDIIKTVDYSTKSDTIITIHGHAQIGKVNKKDIIENSLNQNIINLQNPKNRRKNQSFSLQVVDSLFNFFLLFIKFYPVIFIYDQKIISSL